MTPTNVQTALLLAVATLFTSVGCAHMGAADAGTTSAKTAKSPSDAGSCSPASSAGRRLSADRTLYRFDFVLSATEPGKSPTSSSYTLTLEDNDPGEIRMGSNVALSSNARQDVGLLLRSTFAPVDDNVMLEAMFEMSSLDEPSQIRKITLRGNALVSPGKETMIASLEDPVTHRQTRLSVTAVKVR